MIPATEVLLETLQAEGLNVVDHVPAELAVPEGGLIVLVPAEDYLKRADTFADEYELRLEAHVLVDLVDNDAAAEDLDALLIKLIGVLDGEDLAGAWDLGTITRPGPLTANDWLAHGTTLPLSTITTITPGETP